MVARLAPCAGLGLAVILSAAKDLSNPLYNFTGTLRAKHAAITAKTMLASHSQ